MANKQVSHPGPCDPGRVPEAPGYAPGYHYPYLGGPCGSTWVGGVHTPKSSTSANFQVTVSHCPVACVTVTAQTVQSLK